MLFRGQNILGYKHYADDVVDAFCRKSIENGIDIIRIFDALKGRHEVNHVAGTGGVVGMQMDGHIHALLQTLNQGINPKVLNVDTNTLLYQVPGGMLSNLISQLKQAGKEDKYYDAPADPPDGT